MNFQRTKKTPHDEIRDLDFAIWKLRRRLEIPFLPKSNIIEYKASIVDMEMQRDRIKNKLTASKLQNLGNSK